MPKDRLTPLQRSIANVIARAIFERDYDQISAGESTAKAGLAKAARAIVLLYLEPGK